jgi:hypothetical protein
MKGVGLPLKSTPPEGLREAVPILEILLDPMRIDAIRHGFSLAFGAALVLPHRIGEFA